MSACMGGGGGRGDRLVFQSTSRVPQRRSNQDAAQGYQFVTKILLFRDREAWLWGQASHRAMAPTSARGGSSLKAYSTKRYEYLYTRGGHPGGDLSGKFSVTLMSHFL